jgi:endonuclease/exonuclease/phosphatase (EEP) superfamily protein YafD
MNHLIEYVSRHWFQITVDVVAAMNVIAAGARVMGWTKFASELGKIEDAITAMVQAALKKGDLNAKAINDSSTSASSDVKQG